MSIVAEGFTSVIPLIENRIVDCVIGVGCLDSLERAFPLLINNAVPGIAIPLNTAGCKDTNVDTEYVNAMLRMQSTSSDIYLLDYDYLKTTSEEWFSKSHLSTLLTDSDDQTSAIAREWLGGEGKRWRPYLLAATYLALSEDKDIPEAVQLAAIAVECFHKASLVHDDIQDNDMMRYGKKTVHAEHGVPMAINVGDMLLGEGYRLLTATGNMDLIRVAAEAHIALCKGQGMELEWSISPKRLTTSFVLDIIRHKTVPAFDVALLMGVICSGNNQVLQETLHRYSCALGMAYQLQDDVEDFETDSPLALRPSAVLATLCEQATDEEFVTSLLGDHDVKSFLRLPDNEPKLQDALARVKQLADKYHKEALDALHELRNVELKRLLFRVTKRILK
jgi:geranylgeranyl pyrophosphate synthase